MAVKNTPFSSTYLCEAGYFSYALMKTAYHSRLKAAADLRIQMSFIKPDNSCKHLKQCHSSQLVLVVVLKNIVIFHWTV